MKSPFNNEHIPAVFFAAIVISFGFICNVTGLKIFGIYVLVSHLPYWMLNQLLTTRFHKISSIPVFRWLMGFVGIMLSLLLFVVSALLYETISKNWNQLRDIFLNVFL